MKLSFIYIILVFGLTNCNHSTKSDKNIIQTNFYSTAKVKSIISLNSDSVKNGECFYFDEDGYIDSSVTFLNGTLDGLRKLYYADYGIYTYEYKKGLLSKSKFYDTLNILRYETPLDLKSIAKMTYNFSSNRSYFDQDKVDTITIITKGLPYYNRGISIIGALFTRNDAESYIIKTSKHSNDLKEIKIKVEIFQHLGDTTEIPILFDSLSIPVR